MDFRDAFFLMKAGKKIREKKGDYNYSFGDDFSLVKQSIKSGMSRNIRNAILIANWTYTSIFSGKDWEVVEEDSTASNI